MADRHGIATWPGLNGVMSASYTVSHGITPGTALITSQPQANPPALHGNLVISDGTGRVVIPRCKLDRIWSTTDGGGTRWSISLLDRRWRWREMGVISGTYNVPDHTGDLTRPGPDAGPFIAPPTKYILWTVKQPFDLIKLCLQAMGETRYKILLPPLANTREALPHIDWVAANPAQSLESLCSVLGCRVVYRLEDDSVWIVPLGEGGKLPGGSIARESPAIDHPEKPDRLMLVGAPIRVQMRFRLEAVGEEWDESIRPIDHLSYVAPLAAVRPLIIHLTPARVLSGELYRAVVNGMSVTFTATASTVANVTAGLAAALQLRLGGSFLVSDEGGTHIRIQGPLNGRDFNVVTSCTHGTLRWDIAQSNQQLGRWEFNGPPSFAACRATDRLTYTQAVEKARRSVFRWYRIVNVHSDTNRHPAVIPGFGKVTRIQQVLLLDRGVERLVPEKQDLNIIGRDAQPLIFNYYNGLSHEKPAQCYGSYAEGRTGVVTFGRDATANNTQKHKPILVHFDIIPERGLVVFHDYVYRVPNGHGTLEPEDIWLETSCNFRNADTNEIVRWQAIYDMPGGKAGTPPAVFHHDDIEFLVLARYGDNTRPGHVTHAHANTAEAEARSRYYLLAAASKYQLVGALERAWNGIMPIWLDGAIHQVTWSVGEGGATTSASRNSEHAWYFPRYPERAQIEYLAAPRMNEIRPARALNNQREAVELQPGIGRPR